jgi:hypothetical protein
MLLLVSENNENSSDLSIQGTITAPLCVTTKAQNNVNSGSSSTVYV